MELGGATRLPMFDGKTISPEQKSIALKKAVNLWTTDAYESAVCICKKFAITDSELTQAIISEAKNKPHALLTTTQTTALGKAIKLWNSGQYQRATKLCEANGISTRDFTYALITAMHKED